MKKYFNVNFEFNHRRLEKKIVNTSRRGKGYCCFIDLTSLVHSYKNLDFREVLNNAIVNSCDGSYIAMSSSKIHKENLKEYIGPDFFKKFILMDGKHMIVGSTIQVFEKVIDKVREKKRSQISNISYLELPFKQVEDFDYKKISKIINDRQPNYIWVSLGAPKQEYFMAKLLPYINRGILLGVGAALNYFSGEIKDIPIWARKLHIIWIYRIITEPKKQLRRMTKVLLEFPRIYKAEKKKIRHEL